MSLKYAFGKLITWAHIKRISNELKQNKYTRETYLYWLPWNNTVNIENRKIFADEQATGKSEERWRHGRENEMRERIGEDILASKIRD